MATQFMSKSNSVKPISKFSSILLAERVGVYSKEASTLHYVIQNKKIHIYWDYHISCAIDSHKNNIVKKHIILTERGDKWEKVIIKFPLRSSVQHNENVGSIIWEYDKIVCLYEGKEVIGWLVYITGYWYLVQENREWIKLNLDSRITKIKLLHQFPPLMFRRPRKPELNEHLLYTKTKKHNELLPIVVEKKTHKEQPWSIFECFLVGRTKEQLE